ncbi:MAG: glycosyltransferase [Gammaproteobacteria bacterium]|nr:glycosyltransferase [Gammaproteobacteria bacterium]
MIDFNIVIATYNSEDTLERCLESVRAVAASVSCEVVLIDGASQDNTLGIAEKFGDILSVVVSEPDSGVYEAWNKGLTYCSHPWVMFLGSDDYIRPAEFKEYLAFVETLKKCDFVSCRVRLVEPDGRLIREVGRSWQWQLFRRYMCTLHPGSLTSLDYVRRVGNFDASLKICGDYELLLRAGETLITAFWPKAPVCMQIGGLSDNIRGLNEALQIKLRMGHRARIFCYVDYAIAVAKYVVRTYLTNSR